MNNTGGPAFPLHPVCMKGQEGMTLRDYFAAKVIVQYLEVCSTHTRAAEEAYAVADAMLKARGV